MKIRIISGAVAIVLLVIVLVLHKTVLFPIALTLIGGLMAGELLHAEKMTKEYFLYVWSVIYAGCAAFIPRIAGLDAVDISSVSLYIMATFAYIVISQFYILIRHKEIELGRHYISMTYTVLAVLCMFSLSQMERIEYNGLEYIILTCIGAWVADSGAYFAGTFLGKHKLCPSISPKKTVEGLIGGMAANAVVFFAIAMISCKMTDQYMNPWLYGFIGIVCAILGLLGDLTASLIKRDSGIKDFGNIMPGHGGAMDRFDSLIYIAPFILVILGWKEVFV